jgi:hypothetical protein
MAMYKSLISIAFCVLTISVVAHLATAAEAGKSPISLHAERKPGQTDRVEVRLEVSGDTKFTEDGKPKREKTTVLCDLDYVEKTLEAPTEAGALWRAVRDYQKVSADVKVGDGQVKPTLSPEHRLIAVEVAPPKSLLFSPSGCLTRDELDAIDIQANSLLIDRLLPDKPVSVGDRWSHSGDLLAAMLGLDEVAKTTVESTLKEVTDTVVRFDFAGRIEGAVYGVSTVVELKGRYRFDLRTKRIDWIGMLVKEVREDSHVEVGVDVVSRLAVKITPTQVPASLTDEALAKLTLKPTPELIHLVYDASVGGWQCQYDRRWYIHHQRPTLDAIVLRLVDRGMLSGQCNLSSLPKRDPSKLVSLEEFQKDVERALGKSFGEFIEAGQSANQADCRVYRVVAHGTSSDIPMRWIYYLISDPQGRQVALTFTVEQKLVDRFADADKPLVQSLRFVDKPKDK